MLENHYTEKKVMPRQDNVKVKRAQIKRSGIVHFRD